MRCCKLYLTIIAGTSGSDKFGQTFVFYELPGSIADSLFFKAAWTNTGIFADLKYIIVLPRSTIMYSVQGREFNSFNHKTANNLSMERLPSSIDQKR